MNVNRSRSCLGKNLILKRLDCLKHFDWINLSSNDYAQVFWSIELLMIAANLLNQTTKQNPNKPLLMHWEKFNPHKSHTIFSNCKIAQKDLRMEAM